jgi:cation transporter-like permease
MRVIASIVDTGDLLEVIWVSLVAGIGLTAVYGIAIYGGTRAMDLGRAGRSVEAAAFAVLGTLALAVVVAAMVLGIVVMAHKG